MKECPKELIDAHWGYTEELLSGCEMTPEVVGTKFEFLYRAAAAHFWKHSKEDSEPLINKLNEELAGLKCLPDFDPVR